MADNHLTAEDLKHFEEKLLALQKRIQNEILKLKKGDPFADEDRVMDNAAADTDAREEMDHVTIEAELKELTDRLAEVQHALKKIPEGTYGICEKTGKAIPKARLEIMPEARYLP